MIQAIGLWLFRAGKVVLPAILCAVITLSVLASAVRADPGSGKWGGWLEFGGFYGSDNASRGEVALFAPVLQGITSMIFLDARGKLFEDDVREGNIAVGFRRMFNSGWNLGAWVGFDHRRTINDNSFNQISFGAELLSEAFDFRANGYVPLSDRRFVSTSTTMLTGTPFARLSGNQLFVVTGGDSSSTTSIFELAHYGFDAEIGFRLFGGPGTDNFLKNVLPGSRSEVRVYGGGFWFDAEDALQEISGPRARVEFRIEDIFSSLPGSRLTLEGEFSDDKVRDDKWEIGVRLRIPFGGGNRAVRSTAYAALSAQERRMTEGLERDTDIVSNDNAETTQTGPTPLVEEAAIDVATNVALNQVAFATDVASLQAAVGTGANTLVIAQGAGGNIDVSATNGQALQADQTIQGGGSTINVRGATTGTIVPFTAPGARPTLLSNDTNANSGVVTVAASTHVAGLNVQGPGGALADNFGIRGVNGLNNIVVEQNTISNVGDDAVRFGDNNSNVKVSGNTISNTPVGVRFENTNSNVTVSGNTISNVTNQAVQFVNMNSNVTMSGNTISSAGESVRFGGIPASPFVGDNNSNVTMSNNIISNSGFALFDANLGITTVSGNTISNTSGVSTPLFFITTSDLTVSGNTITGTGAGVNALDFIGTGNNLTVSGNTISDIGGRAMEFSTGSNVTVSGNTISNVQSQAVFFRQSHNGVMVTDNTISNANIVCPGASCASAQGIVEFSLLGATNVTVSGNTLTGSNQNGQGGLRFNGVGTNVTVSDNTITNVAAFGVRFAQGGITVGVTNNTISGAGFGNGVAFPIASNGIMVSGNTISNVLNSVNFGNGSFALTVSDNTISNITSRGMQFGSNNGQVTVSNNSMSNVGDDGMVFGANNNLTLSDNTFTAVGNGAVVDDIFEFTGVGNTMVAGSTGNVVNTAPGGLICNGAGSFTGTLDVTDQNGVLQTFTNGC